MIGSHAVALGQQLVFTRGVAETSWAPNRCLLPGVFLFLVLVAQLSVRLQITEYSYELEQTRTEALRKDTQLRKLRLELAYVSRPQALRNEAEVRLGLVKTLPQQLRTLHVEYKL